ncbi:DnaB-like helicase N-terminal domain-containing protein, partial [Bacillus sp. FSL M7-1431]|uniref:DnaB-like helicase N-terminal domain-containing protein n=1 Tax=Bacillus sp. FSL M7-1431 TaxID=2978219 RepID=UPI0030F7D37D
ECYDLIVSQYLTFRALVSLRKSKQAIDFITITNELQKKNRVEEAGEVSYSTQLVSIVPI